jgi:hypothetical protein
LCSVANEGKLAASCAGPIEEGALVEAFKKDRPGFAPVDV